MTNQNIIITITVTIFCIIGFFVYQNNLSETDTSVPSPSNDTGVNIENSKSNLSSKKLFSGGKLTTDTSIHSIPINKVLSGGPGKDGIPALILPTFVSVENAQGWLPDDANGIMVTINKTTRFYPFNIIVWHEIVNDTIEGTPVTVTFCPLCGSAIVFDARIDNKQEYFGVSGSLYESNLLMYDISTQSLWSQIIGEAVVGTKTGTKLKIIPSQVLSFNEIKNHYPEAEIMSRDTGFNRDYNNGPYGNYDNNDDLYFPISIKDTRLPAKEIMYIVNYDNKSIAFQRNALSDSETAEVIIANDILKAQIIDGEIRVTNKANDVIPGYIAMWFSWATHHQEDGIVWKK